MESKNYPEKGDLPHIYFPLYFPFENFEVMLYNPNCRSIWA